MNKLIYAKRRISGTKAFWSEELLFKGVPFFWIDILLWRHSCCSALSAHRKNLWRLDFSEKGCSAGI
ncbi:MAG: hypothetical protein DBX53_00825 [Clostridiales bacterium]|nr:MAG: hypothetical protein DBX53_00825 [Clostridiales bacterium]